MIVSRTDHCVLEFLFLSHYIQSLQGLEDQTGHTLPMAADDPTEYDAISLCPGIWALEPTSDCQEVRGTDCGSNSQREPSRVPFSRAHTQTCPPSLLELSVTAKDAIQGLPCADSHPCANRGLQGRVSSVVKMSSDPLMVPSCLLHWCLVT